MMASDETCHEPKIEASDYINMADTAARLGFRELAIVMIERVQEELDRLIVGPPRQAINAEGSDEQQENLTPPTHDIK